MNTKQLHDDLVSMINIYGVIAIDDACEILNHYEKTDLTPSTLYPLLKFEALYQTTHSPQHNLVLKDKLSQE